MGDLVQKNHTLTILYRDGHFEMNVRGEIRDDVRSEIESHPLFIYR